MRINRVAFKNSAEVLENNVVLTKDLNHGVWIALGSVPWFAISLLSCQMQIACTHSIFDCFLTNISGRMEKRHCSATALPRAIQSVEARVLFDLGKPFIDAGRIHVD